ncbi:MAG: DUF6504 family protein [Opitutales bacterium]
MEQFVGEGIKPKGNTFNTAVMATGEPGLPEAFIWKGKTYGIQRVVEVWKELGSCSHGSRERYLRKHWYRVETDRELTMKIYFQRQSSGSAKSRWRLYSISGESSSVTNKWIETTESERNEKAS